MTIKNVIYLFACLTLSLSFNLRFLESGDNTYDYSNIQANTKNKNISNATLVSTGTDENVIYISDGNLVRILTSTANKTGDASNIGNSHYYGVNSAVLVNKANGNFIDFNITTNATGSNGISAVNDASVNIQYLTIDTYKANSSGITVNYGGKLKSNSALISTHGDASPCLISEKNGGGIMISNGKMTSYGVESPILYTVGNNITIEKFNTTSYNSQFCVMEGGYAGIKNSFMRTAGKGTYDNNGCIVMFSKNGEVTKFSAENVHFMFMGETDYPYFYITNTKAEINLNQSAFNNEGITFLKASGNDNGWGTKGNNGAEVDLYLNNQQIEGDIEVDSLSQLKIHLQNSTIKGKINNAKTAAALEINLDADSSIELTGNSYYTSINNNDTTGSNINKNSYEFEEYDENFDIVNGSKSINSMILIVMLLLIISF